MVIEFYVNVVGALSVMVIGLIGNTLTALTLAIVRKLKSTFDIYFFCLACFDTIAVVFNSLVSALPYLSGSCTIWQSIQHNFACKIFWTTWFMTWFWSYGLLAAIAVERAICTQVPSAHTSIRKHRAFLKVSAVAIAAFGFVSFRLVSSGIRPLNRNVTKTSHSLVLCQSSKRFSNASAVKGIQCRHA